LLVLLISPLSESNSENILYISQALQVKGVARSTVTYPRW